MCYPSYNEGHIQQWYTRLYNPSYNMHVRENIYRALTPSWRSELAERLRGQHRYTLPQRRNCSSRCRIFARKKASPVHGCTCTGYSRTQKGKKCAPASELMLLSKACWRCCARAASTNLRRSTKRKGGGWLQGWHRVAGSGGLCALWQAGVCHAGHRERSTAGLRARRTEAKVRFFGN